MSLLLLQMLHPVTGEGVSQDFTPWRTCVGTVYTPGCSTMKPARQSCWVQRQLRHQRWTCEGYLWSLCWSSVYPRIPLMDPSTAALTTFLIFIFSWLYQTNGVAEERHWGWIHGKPDWSVYCSAGGWPSQQPWWLQWRGDDVLNGTIVASLHLTTWTQISSVIHCFSLPLTVVLCNLFAALVD